MASRVGSVIVWWVLLMALWVWIDDSIAQAELLVGAAVALVAALLVELAQHQAATRLRIRFAWLAHGLRLPWMVLRDSGVVLGALWRLLVAGEQPTGVIRESPVRVGDDSPEAATRRVLLVAGTSVAPNSFALGIDRDRSVLLVHHLVAPDAGRGRQRRRGRSRLGDDSGRARQPGDSGQAPQGESGRARQPGAGEG